LTQNVGTPFNFSTITVGIQAKDIVTVSWDFGDGNKQSNVLLSMAHTYVQAGPKIIQQTISLIDGSTLTNIIDVDVKAITTAHNQNASLIPAKLIMQTGEPVHYTFTLDGVDRSQLSRIDVDMGDGQQHIVLAE